MQRLSHWLRLAELVGDRIDVANDVRTPRIREPRGGSEHGRPEGPRAAARASGAP
jgi:hypothetical protein